MIDYNKTIDLPVLIVDIGKEVGSIKDFVINYETGQLLGFLLSEGILEKQRVVKIEDVKEIGEDAVMISNDQVILPLKNLQFFKESLDKKIKIRNNTVITESGQKLGEVADFDFDDISNKLAKLYVKAGFIKSLFKGKMIIDFSNIISIGKDIIVVKDDRIKEKIEQPIAEKVAPKEIVSDVMPTQIKTDL